MKEKVSQKAPVTQVPQKAAEGEPAARPNSQSAPTQQSECLSHSLKPIEIS